MVAVVTVATERLLANTRLLDETTATVSAARVVAVSVLVVVEMMVAVVVETLFVRGRRFDLIAFGVVFELLLVGGRVATSFRVRTKLVEQTGRRVVRLVLGRGGQVSMATSVMLR